VIRPPVPVPPAPPMNDVSRRQAWGPRAPAAGQLHPFHPRINLAPPPRTPRGSAGAPVARGRGPGRPRAIAFDDPGRRGVRGKPVECCNRHPAAQGWTKRIGRFARFELPRLGSFLPRVGSFIPRVHFSTAHRVSFPSFFFSEEKEREKGPKCAAGRSTSPDSAENLYPRVQTPIHGFSVDEKRGTSKHWRGFAADQGLIHASTGCFPWGTPDEARAGGAHG
jgi:hypothetical protein